MRGHRFFTSESVSGGHPDKVADQISDAVLDCCLQAAGAQGSPEDPAVRVACETLVCRDRVIVAGEIRLPPGLERPDLERAARQAVGEAGYRDGAVDGFDAETFEFSEFIAEQSPQIWAGTTEGGIGAGDQGMMFGYAVAETEVLMPLPIEASHSILRLHQRRRADDWTWLKPDAKSQVTVEYDGDRPLCIRRAILATQYEEGMALSEVQQAGEQLVREALSALDVPLANDMIVEVNTAGEFTHGGPAADSGLTGRKLMVDTYGAMARHGGGAFSGKDPTKVDRSAAYACRHVAKNLVAAGLTRECEVQVSYSIGGKKPEISVNGFGGGELDNQALTEIVAANFDLSPQGIIEQLRLWQPFYRRHGVLGHFGRPGAPWEQTDRAEALRAQFGN